MFYLPFARFSLFLILSSSNVSFFQQGQWPFFAVLFVDDLFFMIFFVNLVTHEYDLSLGLQSSWKFHTLPFIFRLLRGGMVPSLGWRDSHRLNQHRWRGGSGSGGPSDVGSPLSDGSGLGGRGPDDPLCLGRAAMRPGGRGLQFAARTTVLGLV